MKCEIFQIKKKLVYYKYIRGYTKDKIQQGSFLSKNVYAGIYILIFGKIEKRFFF